MKKQILTEEFKRMQKLAGLINENKNLGPDDFNTFQWKKAPANPDAQLEDLEEGDSISKREFWKNDITGRDPEYSTPSYGGEDNGVWTFSWDSGEISGFIEGEDFTI